jgi:hypothetical protein
MITNSAPWSCLRSTNSYLFKTKKHIMQTTFLGRRQALLQSGGNTGLKKLTGWMQITTLV